MCRLPFSIEIYLPLLARKCYNNGILDEEKVKNLKPLERFLLTAYENNPKNSKILGGDDKLMKEYIKDLDEASHDNAFKDKYSKDWDREEAAIEIGREEGKNSIARNMLKENIAIDLIQKCTGLSIDEIKEIKI